MHSVVVTKQLAAASANNIALSQSLAAAGNLLINGSAASGGVATLDTQRRVILTSAGNDSALTWTVIGTNDDGAPIKDVFLGANGVAQSNLDFKTVTSITGSAATASTVTAGTNGVGSTPWKLFDNNLATPNMSIYLEQLSGTATSNFEYCYGAFLATAGVASSIANGGASPNPTAQLHPSLQSVAVYPAEGVVNYDITGYRLTIIAGTGQIRCTTRQAGLASP
jgi:hypothetical protein